MALSEPQKWLVCFASLGACGAGLWSAVANSSPVDAQRGGAVAVAFTFAMLFLDRGTAKRTLETDVDDKLTDRVGRLENALAAHLDSLDQNAVPLAISSVAGTLFSGFGDLLAKAFGVAG